MMYVWTDDRIGRLKRLAADGLSASQIAQHLDGGVTRCAVIGKLHRLGLHLGSQERVSTEQAKKKKPRARRNAGAVVAGMKAKRDGDRRRDADSRLEHSPSNLPASEATDLPPEQDRPRVALLDLQYDQCRWPLGEPGTPGFGFCGEVQRDEKCPYCAAHARMAYDPRPLKRLTAGTSNLRPMVLRGGLTC